MTQNSTRMIPKPIEAVVGKVTPKPDGSWDIALMPDCTTWLSIHENEVECEPQPGDIVTIQPPYVLAHQSIDQSEKRSSR